MEKSEILQMALATIESKDKRIEKLQKEIENTVTTGFHNKILIENEERYFGQFIKPLQKEIEKERKGRERLRNIYAEKLTENLDLKERIGEFVKQKDHTKLMDEIKLLREQKNKWRSLAESYVN